MRRVLITGAGGFVGRHCLPGLLARAGEVHAVSRLRPAPPGLKDEGGRMNQKGPLGQSSSDSSFILHPSSLQGVRWHAQDLLDAQGAADLVGRVRATHLLHLAWETAPDRYRTSADNLRWLEASLALLRAFADAGGERVVMVGSCAEYDWDHGWCVEGVTPLRPATLYGACKDGLRSVLESYAAQAGLRAAWARLFFLHGPGEHPRRLVASVALSLLAGQVARMSEGLQSRDYLEVSEVADALVALLAGGVTGPVNVGSGQPVRVRAIAEVLGRLTGRADLLRFGELPTAPDEPDLVAADVRRLRDEVGWRPRSTLEEGLARSVEWWRGRGSQQVA